MVYRIGVVGYSGQKFDRSLAHDLVAAAMDEAIADSGQDIADIEIVSGLTDLGIPAIAYRAAKARKIKTAGVACSKAEKYECFPVDRVEIYGDNWGDESETFLIQLNSIIRVGGGKQSLTEIELAKAFDMPVYKKELEAIAQ